MSYYSTWRSDTEDGFYTAYSNATDALATFTFVGVKVDYIAVRKEDRGLCQLTLDGATSYTIDLYDGSGYAQGRAVIWSSPVLEFGLHNVTLSQLGPDARFGYWPYLVTETWTETIPLNATQYTATESVARPSATSNPNDEEASSSTNIAPIVGGVIGGVLAALLFAFLVFLWRRDRQMRDRNEGGAPLAKPKKADGRMAIEDEQPGAMAGAAPANGSMMTQANTMSPSPAWAAYDYRQQSPYGSPPPTNGYAQTQAMYGSGPGQDLARFGQHPAYSHVIVPTSGMSMTSMSPQPAPVGSPFYGSMATTASPPPPSHSRTDYDPVGYRGVTPEQYPYVVQGVNEEKRMYPVPEI
ncbi:hypothetical protein OIO90_000878 [Microbotryomycetes sp. JL221]|nr:hypothetical protein OIO90_000878 [Microbotryomycetes sp. JL221]